MPKSLSRRGSFLASLAALLLALPVAAEVAVPGLSPAERPPAVDAASPALSGLVEVETRGTTIVVVLDRADLETRPDGLADLVVTVDGEAAMETLSFSGQALVEVHPHHLRIAPLGMDEPMVLQVLDRAPAPSDTSEVRVRVGTSLVVHRDLPPLTLREARLRGLQPTEAAGDLRAVAAAIEPDQPGDPGGSGGGCASSCSKTCAGNGGTCSVSCSPGYCARCSCDGAENLASCSCQK